ncbi:MAG TPA: hypothetical protein VKD90_05710 [Gemmataceae bacterium]|nr:hypothetical protein [Gemmataceae bacterium]
MSSRVCLIAIAVAAVLLPGCGGERVAPVKGRVVFNGQPVKEAAITFSPVGDGNQLETGKPATGFTEPDGTFVLSTFGTEDGALVGTHSVNVVLDDTNPAKCKRHKGLTLEVKPGSNEFTIEMDPK